MPRHIKPFRKGTAPFSFRRLYKPATNELPSIPPRKARGNRPMTFTFNHHLQALVYLHLQEYESGRELLQVLEQDEFAKAHIAPPKGVSRSTFFEAMNTRALEQLAQMYERLQTKAKKLLPALHADLGDLVSVDGSLIDAVPTMEFADYRSGVNKANAHLGFNLNHGIPERISLSAGKTDERPFVKKLVKPGQTVVADRYYQCHKNFDEYQSEGRHFVIRIKKSTRKTITEKPVWAETSCRQKRPRRFLCFPQNILGNVSGPSRTDAAGPDQAAFGKAPPLEKIVIAGEDVGEHARIRMPLGEDEEKFFPWRQPGRLGIGFKVRDQVGESTVHEPLELCGDFSKIDRRGVDNDIGLLDRLQHLAQVVIQDAVIKSSLAGVAPLAATVG